MNPLLLRNTALVFHLIGLSLIAGATFLDFVTMTLFWRRKSISQDAQWIGQARRPFATFARIGVALLVLSGIAMMTIMHGVYGTQLWMKIKITVVVLVILNILFVGRRINARFFKIIGSPGELPPMKRRIQIFHLSQMTLILIIVILSVFKFN